MNTDNKCMSRRFGCDRIWKLTTPILDSRRLLHSACVIAVIGTELDTTTQVSVPMPVVRRERERDRDIAVWIVTNMAGTLNVSETNWVMCSRLSLASQRTFVSRSRCSNSWPEGRRNVKFE